MRRIRLATYNIHGCIGRDGRMDVDRIARVLVELEADVVALQEVHSSPGSSSTLDLLAEHAGMHALAGPTMVRADASYGNALLSRRPPLENRGIDLSVAGREPRGALDALFEISGLRLRVLATHLGLRPAERRQQIRRLLSEIDTRRGEPLVLMGDLNEWFLWGRPLRWLHAVFSETPAPATFPSALPMLALDRLWVEPRHLLRTVAAHSSPLARVASDHLPLVGTLASREPGDSDDPVLVRADPAIEPGVPPA